ncbi:MAG: MFS transporter, partial [Pseudomonadota bacterium]
IGPAIAGLLITAVGTAAPFGVNALSCLIAAIAIFCWRPQTNKVSTLPPEPLVGSIATGLRHAANNRALKATLLRAAAFFLCASAFWSLLPLIARSFPGSDSRLYGLLLASVGIGAVGGALLLPGLRKRYGSNRLALAASGLLALVLLTLALSPNRYAAIAASLAGGLAWITTMVNLNLSAQSALPDWVRARGLALFLMVFSGSMTVGSLLWGQVAQATSIPQALVVAAVVLLLPLGWLGRVRIGQGEGLDLSPALAWEKPVVAPTLGDALDRGPVMVTIDYVIDPAEEQAFLTTLHELSASRYGDGAHQWGVYQDAAEPARWTEWFLLPSWAEHLRQHERTSQAGEDVNAAARSFHRGGDRPVVRHLLAPNRGRNS